MRSKHVWLLLGLAACGGGGTGATTTTVGVPDSVAKADSIAKGLLAPPKFTHQVKVAVVDTGAVAPPQSLVRETYGYSFTSASRDPFRPLTNIAVEGPELPDLRLVGLLFNHTDPKMSLLTFQDIQNKKKYTVRPGDRIGRLLVESADSLGATLRVNDFGTISQKFYPIHKEDGN